ncbi:MAG: hypothetical protein JXK07_09135 [Spirochaetes bacterium]|nr:hypothetical protein [Spirochaetota bacterium]MBN2772191.1 hypothetical protein [Spirochaetota bacterium]
MNNEIADILIPFNAERVTEDSLVFSLYVRPESNRVDYEALIAKGLKGIGTPVFMANYNGELIKHKHIVMNHYFLHYLFALHAKDEMLKYPEFCHAFETKFGLSVKKAAVFGAFEYLDSDNNAGFSEKTLFHHYVFEDDFLKFHGHTVKKIGNCYVVDYDIPSIIKSYNTKSNILIISVCCCEGHSIDELNYSLFSLFEKAGVLPGNKSPVPWYNQVKRLYHISSGHIEAMFDLTDFTINSENCSISYVETPLGKTLIRKGIFSRNGMEDILDYFKKYPLVYYHEENERKLINLREAGVVKQNGKVRLNSTDECAEIIHRVIEYHNE